MPRTLPAVHAPVNYVSATPVLASLDIGESVAFWSKLGFSRVHAVQDEYGIVEAGAVQVHFWACRDRSIAEATGCRIRVEGIDALHDLCAGLAVVHPNAPLAATPWGTREFSILDPHGNLVTFHEKVAG